jgi:hypothetical protein
VSVRHLTPKERDDILREMLLDAALFNEKAWVRRYRISARQVQLLRAEARETLARLLAGKPQRARLARLRAVKPHSPHAVLCLTSGGQTGPEKAKSAA